MTEAEFEDYLRMLFKQDFSNERSKQFEEELLARCLAVLDEGTSSELPDDDDFELDDSELELLAAAGDIPLIAWQNPEKGTGTPPT